MPRTFCIVVNDESDEVAAEEFSATPVISSPVERLSVLIAISAAIHACLGGKRVNIVAIRREQPSAWQQTTRALATLCKRY